MDYPIKNSASLSFNSASPLIMHIDLNSCFATIEQQANPLLRGKPIAVAAYDSPGGCILAPSIEAKEYGIKTGMRVREGRALYSKLIVKTPDPWKYRNVHLGLRSIMERFTNDFNPKSIDEFVLNLKDYTMLKGLSLQEVGREIKKQIRMEVGDWLTVSIGIAPNRLLAKVASGLNKPDGLDQIDVKNFLGVYSHLGLTDLTGINVANAARLNSVGIYTVTDFYNADPPTLRGAFKSILGYYWYLRLHGWEIDNVEFARRSYGNSYALPKPFSTPEELAPILAKLVEKMGARLRRAGYKVRGIHLSIRYRDGSHWHKGVKLPRVIFDSRDIYKNAFIMLSRTPAKKAVHTLFVSCFNLVRDEPTQLDLLEDVEKKEALVVATDKINERWGKYVVASARMINTRDNVPDRIAFGGVKEGITI